MHLSRLRVSNFRNLLEVDVALDAGTVLVGENASGKSNLLHALRLVLDSSLSGRQRTLTGEDFHDSLGEDPLRDGQEIEVSVDIEDFEDDPGLVAALAGALVTGEPMRARLTYRFAPRPGAEEQDPPAYEAWIYGADAPDRRVGGELRSYLHHVHMHALRDVEGDITSWRRSPLRPLLEEIARETSGDDLKGVAEALEQASAIVRALPSVSDAAQAIEAQTAQLVGQLRRLEPSLDIAPADPQRTLRALRLYLDGDAQRSLASASLGALNVLYLALLELELARLLSKGEIEHAVISIEEPEAHLHPHLQRRVFAGLLQGDGRTRSTIVSTHSPHIVSVTPPRNLVVLRDRDGHSTAHAACDAELLDAEWDDLARYLDATRSELVFARRVLLVEGFAEQVLLPRLAAPDVELDEHGVSVCAIHGTHFLSYVRFLSAIGTPYAVITDGDPAKARGRTGPERLRRVASALGDSDGDPADLGLFCGEDTFETDLFEASDANQKAMIASLLSFQMKDSTRERIEGEATNGELDAQRLLVHIELLSKGRYAQRLAARASTLDPPGYIGRALAHLLS